MGTALHFPSLLIFTPLLTAVTLILMVKRPDIARIVTLVMHGVLIAISLALAISLWNYDGGYFTYQMGSAPGPFGNEMRAGAFEATLAVVFPSVMFLIILGTKKDITKDLRENRRTLYHVMLSLISASLMALTFTNDIFTAFVFIEVTTIAACTIVAIKENRATLKATIKYLFLSIVGSGLFLLAVSMLYSITGHLEMASIHIVISELIATGQYEFPLIVTLVLFIVGLAVKGALFPFHTWLPDAHGSATTPSSAVLSALVLKGYLMILLKILFRMYGIDNIFDMGILPVLFMLGVTGMIAGSVMALFQKNLKRMVAYSSVAQIGYIYMGMGLAHQAGFVASSYHIIAHAATKALLFVAAGALIAAAGTYNIDEMRGVARKNKLVGAAFVVGALSMAGIPLFAGFVSKFYLAGAAVQAQNNMLLVFAVLGISAFLNAVYYFNAIVKMYSKENEGAVITTNKLGPAAKIAFVCFILANIALGIFFGPLLRALEAGFGVLG
ncbi:MAG: sodium:proton antiporter [Clostridiales bacterium]|jgi:multicomponent Na+:H+ antiporter subunit D|nr:sodium:proton antiporter [Clostridiales bacterium]